MQISEPAEYAILGLLYTEARHGYELFQQFEHGILGEIVHLEMSQMYAFLKKLERLGYIKSEVSTQGTRPPRKVLYLTAEGRDVFLNWLQQPAEKPRDIRILYLIKLYFVQRILPAQTSQLLEKQVQACQQFLASLESRQKEVTAKRADDAEFFDQVVLRSRIYQTRALLDWLDELKTEIGVSH